MGVGSVSSLQAGSMEAPPIATTSTPLRTDHIIRLLRRVDSRLVGAFAQTGARRALPRPVRVSPPGGEARIIGCQNPACPDWDATARPSGIPGSLGGTPALRIP